MTRTLAEAELDHYHRTGFLLVRDLVPPAEVCALGKRLREYTHGGRPTGALRIQVEPRVTRGELAVEHPGDGIRKIDGLVENDDLFERLGKHPNLLGVLTSILGPDIKMFRNALLLKPPEVGSAKGMHQDSPYWPIEPMELCSCWFPLDNATLENGCMAVIAGAHRRGGLPHISVRDDYVVDPDHFNPDDMETLPMQAGDGLFFHSLLPHYTAPNRSDTWRRAIALSYMSAQSRYTGEGEGPVYYPIQGRSFEGCVL
ncbi:MAG: phytanoyl-CoA dioxygenase family protein [Caldilineaceae bacterium]|nr:phytanoyl-CoA dioxygenase family protein [Caldilineaceae bacterium]